MSANEGVEPFPPSEALALYGSDLTEFEKKEILEYPSIYYVGQRCLDKVESPSSGPNNGFDENNGEYRTVTGDHLAYRYEIVETLGSGAFGQVVKAIDHSDNTLVAIKLIRNRRKITLQAKSEINILRHIREEDPTGRFGIVIMFDDFVFRNHVCIVYEILGSNLYDEMKSHNFYPMKMYAVRQIAARVLVSLTFLWKENIMHCDLKPENILIKGQETTSVRVVDLGSACYDTSVGFMYIQSRFYRAPEVIMGSPYGRPIDLWSYGCILCELATGYPVFPGEDETDQLFSIMEYLGPPPAEIVAKCRFKSKYFNIDNTPKKLKNPRGEIRVPGSKSLADFLALPEDSNFVSFIKQFFVWDPNERVTPREAMQHPWIVEEFVFAKSKADHEDSVSNKDEGDDDPFKQTATAGNGMVRTRPARTAAPMPQSSMSDNSSVSLSPGMKPATLVMPSEASKATPATNGTKPSATNTTTTTTTATTTTTTAATQPPRATQPPPLTQLHVAGQPHSTNRSAAAAPQPHAPSQRSSGTRASAAANPPVVNGHSPIVPLRHVAKPDPPAGAKARQITRLFPTNSPKKPVPPQNPPTERVERTVPGLAPPQPAKASSAGQHKEAPAPKNEENGTNRTSRRTSDETVQPPASGQSVQDRIKTFEAQIKNSSPVSTNLNDSGRAREVNPKGKSRSGNPRYSMNDVQDSLQGSTSVDKQIKGSDQQPAARNGAVPRPSTTTDTGVNSRRAQLEELPPAESTAKETVYCPTTRRRIVAGGHKGKLSEVKAVPDANQTQLPSIEK